MAISLCNKQYFCEHGCCFDVVDTQIGKKVGSVELLEDWQGIFVEMIKRKQEYSGNKYLPQIIKELQNHYLCDIVLLPLEHYETYYEEIGFERIGYNEYGDCYYILRYNDEQRNEYTKQIIKEPA